MRSHVECSGACTDTNAIRACTQLLALLHASPAGVQMGWPMEESGGRPATGATRQLPRPSTNSAGGRLPVFSSPQSSCIHCQLSF